MPPTNRLADEESPYLKEAAHQPVDWHPWSDEAFARARREGKPVLVDSGAVWCHWCHVMDHESYEDPEIAALINTSFVPIKLDRDERPHVDARLQAAVGAITGRGGWPLTAFLTPEGDVFYGGTYFPPKPAHGMPSFREVLTSAARFYRERTEDARDQAAQLKRAVERAGELEPGPVARSLVDEALADAMGRFDPVHGGFARAPKFFHAGTLELLLLEGDDAAVRAAHDTLEAMAQGGVVDHVGGGFHRYSVDAHWTVPHFEKMLYDNAALLGVYALAAARAATDEPRRPLLLGTARHTSRFLLEVLARPTGGFGGSQDADVRPETKGPLTQHDLDDGDFFTWSLAEVEAALEGDALKLAKLHFGVAEEGEMHHDPSRNVLHVVASLEDIAATLGWDHARVAAARDAALEGLATARAKREAPIVDPTVYANWNGGAMTALLQFDAWHGAPEAGEAALAALGRLSAEAWRDETGYAHALSDAGPRVWGLLDDQAQMLPALLEAHLVAPSAGHLDRARSLAELVLTRYRIGPGRYRVALDDDAPASAADSPTPSPIATLALHLPRLARLTGEERFARAVREDLEALHGEAHRLGGLFGATLALAIAEHLDEPPHVVVTGSGDEADALAAAARGAPVPRSTLVRAGALDEPGVPEEARAAARAFAGEAVAVVCRGRACTLARTPSELKRAMGRA